MLTADTPFPYAGSYALLEDEGELQLVRIQWRRCDLDGAHVMVSFPLRDGATGNKVVAEADLVDATPLTAQDAREFHDLDRHLAGRSLRTPKQKREAALRDRLKKRMIHAPIMERLLRQARGKAFRQRRAA